MNLPHLPPVRFATSVLQCDTKKAIVACTFPELPTLSMFVEGAAQATSAWSTSSTPIVGFLVLLKDVTLHVKPQGLDAIVVVEERLSLGQTSEFGFDIYAQADLKVKIASGIFMIVLQG